MNNDTPDQKQNLVGDSGAVADGVVSSGVGESGSVGSVSSAGSSSAAAPVSAAAPATAPVEEQRAATMIVVLARRAAGMQQTVNFLERRGFAARVVQSVTDAVDLFTRKEANMLLLSVNFPHPKVDMLPVLMNQSFKVETILFAEDSDRKSQSKLNNAKTKHVLFGPVSGPVVLTKMRLIERELNGDDDASRDSASRASASRDEEGDIKVGGKRASNDDTVVLNGRAAPDRKVALDQLMKTLDSDEAAADGAESTLERSGDVMVAKGQRSKKMSSEQDAAYEEPGDVLSEQAQDLRSAIDQGLREASPADKPKLILPLPTRPGRRASLASGGAGFSAAEAAIDPATADAEEAALYAALEKAQAAADREKEKAVAKATSEKEKIESGYAREKERADAAASREAEGAAAAAASKEATAQTTLEKSDVAKLEDDKARELAAKDQSPVTLHAPLEKSDSQEKASGDSETAGSNTKAGKAAEVPAPNKTLELEAMARAAEAVPTAKEKEALPPEEKIRRCLREALAIVAGAPVFGLHEMKEHKAAALIALRSKAMTCSFIISLNYSKKTAAELFHRIEVAFFSLLRDYGAEFDAQDVYSVFLDKLNVVSLAFEESEFVVVTSTAEIEIGLAKVITKNPVATLVPYADNMLSVNIAEIPLDEPVSFSLYIHLKQNQKFIRYLKQGSTLSTPQARRLEERRAMLLVDQQDREAYRRHFAANAIEATPRKHCGA